MAPVDLGAAEGAAGSSSGTVGSLSRGPGGSLGARAASGSCDGRVSEMPLAGLSPASAGAAVLERGRGTGGAPAPWSP